MKSCSASFHYLTIDQVNAATAEELAEQHGVALELAEPRDMARLENENALLVVDWDFLPQEYRDHVLASSALRVVAIHSYNISDSMASFLPRRGILCFKMLSRDMFRKLKGLATAA